MLSNKIPLHRLVSSFYEFTSSELFLNETVYTNQSIDWTNTGWESSLRTGCEKRQIHETMAVTSQYTTILLEGFSLVKLNTKMEE